MELGKLMLFSLILGVLSPGAAADLEVDVALDECREDYNPLISVASPNETTGNPGAPGRELFLQKICVSDVAAPEVRKTCPGTPGFSIYSQGTDAHFSNRSIYPLEVCTGRLEIKVRNLDQDGDGNISDDPDNPCENGEKQLFSVSNRSNAHIASPYSEFYPYKACGFLKSFRPENVSLKLEFNLSSNDEVEADSRIIDPGQTFNSIEYPYIASSGSGFVAGIVSGSAESVTRQLGDRNKLEMRKNSPAEFYLPFTSGGFQAIESNRDQILNDNFLGDVSPSFGTVSNPPRMANVILDSGIEISENESLVPGSYELVVEKTGANEVSVTSQ